MSIAAVPFPGHQPQGYTWLTDEPEFNPGIHLALETPSETSTLDQFGYSQSEIKTKASNVAASTPFRVLSEEGAAIMLETARRLKPFSMGCERIENMVRGGCYRSKFLRDLCTSPELTALMCEIYGVDVAPHTMPLHLGHMNYTPDDLDKAVDKWHHDTLPLDFVMMVTDPTTLDGGQFEYFTGSKHEMAELAAAGKTPPKDRVIAPHFPAAGYAIALHGDMIVHRGAKLNAPGERISMVNGYVATNTQKDDQHRHKDLSLVDDPECLYAEWAKHAAWRARCRLDTLIADIDFSSDASTVADNLRVAVEDVTQAIDDMRSLDNHVMHHYEK